MSLFNVLDAVGDRISTVVGADVRVGPEVPADGDELPALTLSADGITQRLTGIGAIPRGARTGALAVVVEIDLAEPVVDYGGGVVLALLSADRRTLTLPNGPLVRADGAAEPPFSVADLRVEDTEPYAVVATDPSGREVRPDPAEGTLAFGQPLPATGMLTVHHFLGQWEVTVARYRGELSVVVTAAGGEEIDALSRQVNDALTTAHALGRFRPRALGATRPHPVGDTEAVDRLLGYLMDVELEEPKLPSGGGVVSTVAVEVHADDATETFTVARQGGPA